MRVKFILLGAILLLTQILNTASGFDQDNIEMHGFVSQGFLKSSDNDYLGRSKEGSLEFNEIGVNFAVFVMSDLRFGVQFFSSDLGDSGNNEFKIDWALMDYSYKNWLGLRAGKIKLPFGLYNRKRDADMLRTSVVLNQSVYSEKLRDLIVGFYGISLYGSCQLGKYGYIDYEFYVGTLEASGDSPFITSATERSSYLIPELRALLPQGFDYSSLDIYMRHLEGGMLVWNTFVDGLRVSYTDVMSQLDIDMGGIITDTKLKKYSGFSFEYDTGNLTFVFERLVVNADMEAIVVNIPVDFEGWYGEISWDLRHWFSLNLAYGEYYPASNDKSGSKIEKSDLEDYYAWQKDITVGVRFNMNEYWCIKFETHFIDGLGLVKISENISGDEEQYWRLFAVKTSLSF